MPERLAVGEACYERPAGWIIGDRAHPDWPGSAGHPAPLARDSVHAHAAVLPLGLRNRLFHREREQIRSVKATASRGGAPYPYSYSAVIIHRVLYDRVITTLNILPCNFAPLAPLAHR